MELQEAINKTKEYHRTKKRQQEEKEVIEKYGSMFNPKNIDRFTKEEFKSFLLIENNKHWEGIHRQSNMITQDMDKLKEALKILLDESKPLKNRLDFLFPKDKPSYIKGLGRAVVTPILMVVYPDKYGVYNRRSDEGLKEIGLEPKFSRGADFSEKYIKVNKVLNELASKNDLTLFQLDSVWWILTEGYESTKEEMKEEAEITTGFGLEQYLRRFLVDNWDNISLGRDYAILEEDGEIIGEEYQTKEVGIIDILARGKKTSDWIVIELKRGQTSDAVVGQILRYMNWIKEKKATKVEKVKGIIVVKELDEKLKNSLALLRDKIDISCFVYNVQFLLEKIF